MDLYFKKKEQMNSSNRSINVVDANIEIEKKRAQSPVPQRNLQVSCDKKVAYKNDIDELKSNHLAKYDELNRKLDQLQLNLESKNNELKKSIEDVRKNIESSKVENLKNTLNETIRQQNNNIEKISDELIRHLDNINGLKADMVDIKNML